MRNKEPIETSVLICGAGPVGLSLSLALSRLGIDNVLVEKHPGTSIHPKARGVNVRVMELMRLWGVETAIREKELPAHARRFLWLESVQGKIIGEAAIHEPVFNDSPTHGGFVTQDIVEQALLNALLEQSNSAVRFSTQLTSLRQDKDGVECVLFNKKTQASETVRCQYAVAADGAHSFIRHSLNIKMQGIENISSNLSVLCNVDTPPLLNDQFSIVAVLTEKALRGKFIMAVDFKKRWVIAQRIEHAEKKFSSEYCQQLVRDVCQNQDLSVEVINASVWGIAALNAEVYQKGRVFLAGDSAHRIPPTGGMGMNTGIQDAHNLAWKLAYVIQGYADPLLLESYQEERRPLAQFTIDWSASNGSRLHGIFDALERDDQIAFKEKLLLQSKQLSHRGLDLGFIYGSIEELDPNQYQPSTLSGARAPHCNIVIDGKLLSTLDLFEREFVLIIGSACKQEDLLPSLPIPRSYPLKCYRMDHDFTDVDDNVRLVYGITESGAVLIRPDGHVAWSKEPSSESGRCEDTCNNKRSC